MVSFPFRCIVVGFLAASVACSTASDSAVDADADEELESGSHVEEMYLAQVESAVALGYADDYPRADRVLTSVISQPSFRRLPAATRHEALSLAAYAATHVDDPSRARDLMQRAVAIDPGTPGDWLLLSHVEVQLGNPDASALHLARYAREWPEQMQVADLDTISVTLNEIDPGSSARLELLQALFDAEWTRRHIDMSEFWYDLALLRVQQGETTQAAEVIGRIAAPDVLVKLRSDKRFDALIDPGSSRFDVELAAATQVDALRQQARNDPDNLEVTTALLDALLTIGNHDEVLDVTRRIITAVENDPDGTARFEHLDQLNWIRNLRATALARQGRFDEVLGQMVRASQLDESGRKNVSQTLNLAGYYATMDRPDDALATIAQVGRMSDYGRMVLEAIRHQASVAKGDEPAAAASLHHLREHSEQAPGMLIGALIEANQIDEAARALIAMLESPHERGDVLHSLQHFIEPPLLPSQERNKERWEALRDHKEVRRAVEQVGRIQRYAIYNR